MDYEQIVKIIDKFNNSKLTELAIEEGNFKIALKSDLYGNKNKEKMAESGELTETNQNISEDTIVVSNEETTTKPEIKPLGENLFEIVCPLVGTFYSSKTEGEEPFIKVGDTVKEGQVIGIVEAMKLMNEITATCSGVVEEILVENEELVEYGQIIVKIRKN